MASRTRAWSSLAAVLLLLCITAVACLPAARALEASAAEASPAEASAELGDSAARQAARQAARASDRVFDRLRVRAEEQIGARVHERRTERRGTPGGDAGAANHPRATDPDPPNDHTVTPQEEVDGMITQLLDRASKVKLGPADAHSKDDETLPSDSAANTATAKTAAAKTTAAKTVAAKTVAEPVVTESSAMNENLRARLEAATTAAAEARLELAATKTQLEVATDAAAKARLAAKTDTDRDAALAEARDQRVVNERLRVELEAAKEAAAEARLAADEAAGAAAKLSVGRDSDAESGSDSGSRSGPASNARREVWVTVQVPVLETDDSKTSLSSRVVPALVDIARDPASAASPRRARRSPRRDSSSSAGSSSRARRRTEAKTRTPSRAPPSPWTWRFPPSACSATVTARTSRERVGWCSPSRMTRPTPESSLASSRFSTRPGTPKAPPVSSRGSRRRIAARLPRLNFLNPTRV